VAQRLADSYPMRMDGNRFANAFIPILKFHYTVCATKEYQLCEPRFGGHIIIENRIIVFAHIGYKSGSRNEYSFVAHTVYTYSVTHIKVYTPMREHGPCVDRVFKTKHGPQPIANLFSSSSLTTLVFTASCVSQKISAKILKTCQKSSYPGTIRLINKFLTVGGL